MLARNVKPITIPRRTLSNQPPPGHILSRVNRAVAPAPAAPVAPAAPIAPARAAAPAVARDVPSLSVSTQPATIYGCSGLFDLCSDQDLMSLSFQAADPFLDWIGWERTNVCRIKKNFIAWQRPAYSGATPTVGYVGDPCADPNGVDWGVCDFKLEDFGRLRRHGPVRDITKLALRLCEAQPRYRLDGTAINDDREYDMRIITEVVLQDLRHMVINGNASTAGQFDGLQRLVKSSYLNSDGDNCQLMNSTIINWNGNALSGGAGETWNGAAIGTGFNFIDVLNNVYRNIRQRIGWAPALAAQPFQVGDMVLVMPSSAIDCLLNFYTCWRVCPGVAYNENNLLSLEARTFRDNLMGGMFGAGRIFIHGQEIPILPYDWGLMNGANRFDAYLLTGSIGNVKLISGQYNDMGYAQTVRPERYSVTDGGRLLTYSQDDHTCEQRIVEMQPRLLAWAPWAMARFQNMTCATPGPRISVDPTSSFFPETSFESATGGENVVRDA